MTVQNPTSKPCSIRRTSSPRFPCASLSPALLAAVFLGWAGPVMGVTTGFNQNAAGPWDYNAAGNWVGNSINGIWDTTLTLAAAQTVTLATDTTLSTGLTFTYGGNRALTLASASTNSQTLTLGGNVSVSTSGGTAANVTLGDAAKPLNVNLGGATRTLEVASSRTMTIQNDVVNGGIVKAGAGTLTMNGSNTYTGGTTVSAGTLVAGNANALPAASTVALCDANSGANAVTLWYMNGIDHPVTVANQGTGTVTFRGSGNGRCNSAITLNRGVTLFPGNTFYFTGGISGTGDVTIPSAGGWKVCFFGNTSNTFTGNLYIKSGAELDLSDGTVQSGSAIPDTANVDVAAGGVLYLVKNGNNETINALTGGGLVKGYYDTLTLGACNGSGTFSGSLQNGSGSLALVKTGTGTQALTGASSYSGGTTLLNGMLVLGHTNACAKDRIMSEVRG